MTDLDGLLHQVLPDAIAAAIICHRIGESFDVFDFDLTDARAGRRRRT